VRKGCVAAFAFDRGDEERLGVVTEVDARPDDFDAGAVLEAIRKAVVSKHQVEPAGIVLIEAKSIPKTSSGKIQRSRLADMIQAGELRDRIVHGDVH
jgi:acyl-coenzyme A synthetase/AMP-(fatty) acid ligase